MSRSTGKEPRNPPIRIPLSFNDLASNIFKVDTSKLPASARPGAAKKAVSKVMAAKKKAGKKP